MTNKTPLMIRPQTCVDTEEIQKNITKNVSLVKDWVGAPTKEHDRPAAILSAGPSLERFLVKERPWKYATLFAVKHTLPLLKHLEVAPEYCVVLDPREVSGVSTHGKVRKDLFLAAHEDTTFLVASMTHPSVTEFLLETGHKVVGWHALAQGIEKVQKDQFNDEKITVVAGGTSSAMRSISLAHLMGFRTAQLFGFDSCFEEMPNAETKGLIEKLRVKQKDGTFKTVITTGELLAQAQDLEKIFGLPPEKVFMKLECKSDGLCRDLFDYYT